MKSVFNRERDNVLRVDLCARAVHSMLMDRKSARVSSLSAIAPLFTWTRRGGSFGVSISADTRPVPSRNSCNQFSLAIINIIAYLWCDVVFA